MQHPMALLTNLDIFKHFQKQRSAERVELLTGLLRMCVPLEISFLSAVIDEIMHREVRELKSMQDQAAKANKREELMKLDATDMLVVQRLCVYTALLSSNNYLCADRIFTLIKAINERRLSSATSSNADNASDGNQQESSSADRPDSVCTRWRAEKESELENFLLLCALARAHPAFRFADKRVLGEYIDAASDTVQATLTDVNNNNQSDLGPQTNYGAPNLPPAVDSNSELATEQRYTDTTERSWKMDEPAHSDLGCDTSDVPPVGVQDKNEDEKVTCDPRDDASLAAALRVQTNLCCQLTKDRFDITLASCEFRQSTDWSVTLRIAWCGETASTSATDRSQPSAAPHSATLDSKPIVHFVTRTRKHFHDTLSKLDCEWLSWLHESRESAPSGTSICVTSASHSRRIDLARVYETSIPSAQVFSHHQLSRVCDHASLRSVLTEFIQSIGQIPACIVKEVLIRDSSLTANCGAPNDYVDGLQSAACAAQANCATDYGLQPNTQQRQQSAFVRPSAVAYSGVPLTAYPQNAATNNCPASFVDGEQRDATNGSYYSVADSARYRVNGNTHAYRLVNSYNHLVPFGNMSPGTFVQTGLAQSTLGTYANAYQPGAVPYQQAYQNAYTNVYQAAYSGQLQPSAATSTVQQPSMYGPTPTPTPMPYRVNAAQQQPYNTNVANVPHTYVPAIPTPNWAPSQLPQQQHQQQQQPCTCFECQSRYRSAPDAYGATQGQMQTVIMATAAGVQTSNVPYPYSSYSYVAQPNVIHSHSIQTAVSTPLASVGGAAAGPRQNTNANQYSAMLQDLNQLTLCTTQMQPQSTGQADIAQYADSVTKANAAEPSESTNQSAATAPPSTYANDVTSQIVAFARHFGVASGHNSTHMFSPSTTVDCTNMNNNNCASMSPNHRLAACTNPDSANVQLNPQSSVDGASICLQPSTSTETTISVSPTNALPAASESTPLNTTQTVTCSSANYYSTSSSQTSSTSSFVSIVDCTNQQNDADSETADMAPSSNQHAVVTTSGQAESDTAVGSADDAHGDSASQSQTSASDNDAAADYRGGLSHWFKTLRLHKYFERVATLSVDKLLELNDEQLRELGFTTGAARKFIAARQALDLPLRSGDLARGGFPRALNPSASNSQVATTSSSSSASIDSHRSASTRRKEQRSAPGAASCELESNADAFVSDSVAERDVAAQNDSRRIDPASRRSAMSTSSSSPAVFAAPARHQSYQRRGSLSYRSYAHPQSHRAHRASSAADFYMSAVFPPDNFPLSTFGLTGGVGMNDVAMMDGAFPPGSLNPVAFGAMNDATFATGVNGGIPLTPLGVPANANVYHPIGLPPGMHMNALGFGMMADPLLNAAAPFPSPNAPPSQLVTCVNQILNAGTKSQPLFLAFVTR